VTLCDFHHALEPDDGHQRIWGNIKSRYFTVVRAHIRLGGEGRKHKVKAHIRRLELVQEKNLQEINNYHQLTCPKCEKSNLHFNVDKEVNIRCASCKSKWRGAKALAEETGPKLAEQFIPSQNKGVWKPRWDMLASRKNSSFSDVSSISVKKKARKKPTIKGVVRDVQPPCPLCEAPVRLVTPRPGDLWIEFWGCSLYSETGCKGSRRI